MVRTAQTARRCGRETSQSWRESSSSGEEPSTQRKSSRAKKPVGKYAESDSHDSSEDEMSDSNTDDVEVKNEARGTTTGKRPSQSKSESNAENKPPPRPRKRKRVYTTQRKNKKTKVEETKVPEEKETCLTTVWRKEGNDHYKAATSKSLDDTEKEKKLQSAIYAYQRAMDNAGGDFRDEYSSAAKNYAMTEWRLAEIFRNREGKIALLHYHFSMAFEYFEIALSAGRHWKTAAWKEHLLNESSKCVREALNALKTQDMKDRIRLIEGYIKHMNEGTTNKADCYLEIADILFKLSVVAIHDGLYKDCVRYVKEAYFPVEEARRCGKKRPDIEEKVDQLKEDLFYQQCAAESIQARIAGDELLAKAIKDEEELNMDMIWEIVDHYKNASILGGRKEIELEAIAITKLGMLYHNVLKNKIRAKEYLMMSHHLISSLHPKTFYTEDWYRNMSLILAEYQRQKVKEEEERHAKEAAPFLRVLKPELKILDEMKEKGTAEFVNFVYKTYPPKNPKHQMYPGEDMTSPLASKKTVQTAILHYHPDKQDVDEYGRKWQVLCEEITKRLTVKYEWTKQERCQQKR